MTSGVNLYRLACISQSTRTLFASRAGSTPIFLLGGTSEECMALCQTDTAGSHQFSGTQPASDAGDRTGINCVCYDDLLSPKNIVSSVDNSGYCAATDFQYLQNDNTLFNSLTCFGPPSTAPSDLQLVSSFQQCFTQCGQRDGASIIPTSTGSYQCFCDLAAASAGSADICKIGNIFSFNNLGYIQPANPEVSAASRKRNLKNRLAAQALSRRLAPGGDLEFCPEHMLACSVGKSDDTGYECVDTKNELESCGGCVFGQYGTPKYEQATFGEDCSRMKGVPLGASTCRSGSCIAMACLKGYALIDGSCELD